MKKLTLSSLLALSLVTSISHAAGSQVGKPGGSRIDVINVLAERPCANVPLCFDVQGSTIQNQVPVSKDIRQKLILENIKNVTVGDTTYGVSKEAAFVGSDKNIGMVSYKAGPKHSLVLRLFDRRTLKLSRELTLNESEIKALDSGKLFLMDNDNVLVWSGEKNTGYAGEKVVTLDLRTLKISSVEDYSVLSIFGGKIYAERDPNGHFGTSIGTFNASLEKISSLSLKSSTRLWPEADVSQGDGATAFSSGQTLLTEGSGAFLGSEDGKSLLLTVPGPKNKDLLFSARVDNVVDDVKLVNTAIWNHALNFNENTCAFEGDATQSKRANRILQSIANSRVSNLQLKDFGILLKSQFLTAFPNISSYMRLLLSLNSSTAGTFGSIVDSSKYSYDASAEDLTCLRKITRDREVSSRDFLGEDMTISEFRAAMPIVQALGPNLETRYQAELVGWPISSFGRSATGKIALAFRSEILSRKNQTLKVYMPELSGLHEDTLYINQEVLGVDSVSKMGEIAIEPLSEQEFDLWQKYFSVGDGTKVVFTKKMQIPTTRGTVLIEIKYMSRGNSKVSAHFQ